MKKTYLKSFFLFLLLLSFVRDIDKPLVSTEISIETEKPTSDIPIDDNNVL